MNPLTESPPQPLFVLQNTKPVTVVLFSTLNSDILYTGNRDGDFTVYTLKLRRPLFSANHEKQAILSIIELNISTILTYIRNGSIYKWVKTSQDSYKSECVYQKEVYTFCQISFNDVSNQIFLPAEQTSLIDCIDERNFKHVNTFKFNKDISKLGLVMSMKAIDEFYLLAGFESGEIILFDSRGFSEVSRLNLFKGHPLISFDYLKRLNFGCSGSSENEINTFRIDEHCIDGYLNQYGIEIKLTNPGVNIVKIRQSDSKIFATGGWDNRIRLFGTKKQNSLVVIDFHKSAVNTIDFSVQNLMAVGSNDGIISFWNFYV